MLLVNVLVSISFLQLVDVCLLGTLGQMFVEHCFVVVVMLVVVLIVS